MLPMGMGIIILLTRTNTKLLQMTFVLNLQIYKFISVLGHTD